MQFHVMAFEGLDGYARVGGIATRVSGLTQALASLGHETHLWFIGDPDLIGHERRGQLHLHRWCQWISRYHRSGVYDGEEGKRSDYAASLPPHLLDAVLAPALRGAQGAVILAEEWQTVDAVLHLDWLLRRAGLRENVTIFWNANNNYCFECIDWERLKRAAVITTVSRYMKHLMWRHGVDPLVIANGLAAQAYLAPDRDAVTALRDRVRGRSVVTKVARFHPDKRWLMAVDTIREMKAMGLRPLLVARGGVESHGTEVLGAAAQAGLRVADHKIGAPGIAGLLCALERSADADILNLQMPLDEASTRLLFHGSDAVLANSGHEPFGLVGLETMAVGGVAYVGSSGEDYAVPGHNALVLETNDAQEFIASFQIMRNDSRLELALRRAARTSAQLYAWPQIIERMLLPRLSMLAGTRHRGLSGSTDAVSTLVSAFPARRATRRRAHGNTRVA